MKSFVFLALLAALTAAGWVRVWDCPLCGCPPAPVSCPSCRDRGRASTWTRLRYRREPSLRVLLEHRSPDFSRALAALLQRQKADRPLLRAPYVGEARFAVCDGEDVVVVLAQGSLAGLLRTEAWMLDLQGNLKDRFDTLLSSHDGIIAAGFGRDGVALRLWVDSSGLRAAPKTITIRQDGRPLQVVEGSDLRLRLAGGKFERVLP